MRIKSPNARYFFFDGPVLQVYGNLEVSPGDTDSWTGSSHPTLVIRAGVLSPGRSYTFSMTATDLAGGIVYTGERRKLSSMLLVW